ncbi:MAG: inositol monophosphatase [Bdellovibrionales bacterium]|nr:inositol monophosphatase [Bdellovibrionales bacterium]
MASLKKLPDLGGPGNLKQRQKLAKEVVRAALSAGKTLLKFYKRPYKISEKKGAGLVTEADLAAEKAAMRILEKARPDFDWLTEEAAPQGAIRAADGIASQGRWVCDPLDGTTNFVHKFPMFCVSLAAEWKGEVIVGVIYHPILKDLYVGIRGGGSFLNGKPMKVSGTEKLSDSLLSTGFTYRKGQWLHAEMEAFERLSGIARAVRRPGSAALDLAYTARGVFDGFWERKLAPWDVAAGSLIIEEAGGTVTDFQGKPYRLGADGILASNPKLHPSLLSMLAPELCAI